MFSFSFWRQYKTDRKTPLSKDFSNILIQNQACSQKQNVAITCSVFQGLVLITDISFQHFIQFSSAWNKNKPEKTKTELQVHVHLHYFRKFNFWLTYPALLYINLTNFSLKTARTSVTLPKPWPCFYQKMCTYSHWWKNNLFVLHYELLKDVQFALCT